MATSLKENEDNSELEHKIKNGLSVNVYGGAGIGKTHGVTKILKKNNLSYKLIQGWISSKIAQELLYPVEKNNKIIVFNDIRLDSTHLQVVRSVADNFQVILITEKPVKEKALYSRFVHIPFKGIYTDLEDMKRKRGFTRPEGDYSMDEKTNLIKYLQSKTTMNESEASFISSLVTKFKENIRGIKRLQLKMKITLDDTKKLRKFFKSLNLANEDEKLGRKIGTIVLATEMSDVDVYQNKDGFVFFSDETFPSVFKTKKAIKADQVKAWLTKELKEDTERTLQKHLQEQTTMSEEEAEFISSLVDEFESKQEILETKIPRLTKDQVEADDLKRNKDGTYTAYKAYFYRGKNTPEGFADRIKQNLPDAVIIDSGDVWKTFKGGASVRNQSHFWVTFKVPTANETNIVEPSTEVKEGVTPSGEFTLGLHELVMYPIKKSNDRVLMMIHCPKFIAANQSEVKEMIEYLSHALKDLTN
jgi:hypothetical protein